MPRRKALKKEELVFLETPKNLQHKAQSPIFSALYPSEISPVDAQFADKSWVKIQFEKDSLIKGPKKRVTRRPKAGEYSRGKSSRAGIHQLAQQFTHYKSLLFEDKTAVAPVFSEEEDDSDEFDYTKIITNPKSVKNRASKKRVSKNNKGVCNAEKECGEVPTTTTTSKTSEGINKLHNSKTFKQDIETDNTPPIKITSYFNCKLKNSVNTNTHKEPPPSHNHPKPPSIPSSHNLLKPPSTPSSTSPPKGQKTQPPNESPPTFLNSLPDDTQSFESTSRAPFEPQAPNIDLTSNNQNQCFINLPSSTLLSPNLTTSPANIKPPTSISHNPTTPLSHHPTTPLSHHPTTPLSHHPTTLLSYNLTPSFGASDASANSFRNKFFNSQLYKDDDDDDPTTTRIRIKNMNNNRNSNNTNNKYHHQHELDGEEFGIVDLLGSQDDEKPHLGNVLAPDTPEAAYKKSYRWLQLATCPEYLDSCKPYS